MSTINLASPTHRAANRKVAAKTPVPSASAKSVPFAVSSPAFERLQHGDSGFSRLAWLALPAGVVVLIAALYATSQTSGGSDHQSSSPAPSAQPSAAAQPAAISRSAAMPAAEMPAPPVKAAARNPERSAIRAAPVHRVAAPSAPAASPPTINLAPPTQAVPASPAIAPPVVAAPPPVASDQPPPPAPSPTDQTAPTPAP